METLATLLEHPGAPGLVHLHHPHHPASALQLQLRERCKVARLDAVEHHNQRLLYAGILSRLAGALGKEYTDGEVLSWDAFARGLRSLWTAHTGKGKKRQRDEDEGQIVVFITKAERLRSVLGAEWTAMTRISELAGVPATVVLCSQMPWDDLRPPHGEAPEPIHLYLEPMQRDEIISALASGSPHPLYPHFVDLVTAALGHLAPTSPPSELDYVATALWPIYTASLPQHEEQIQLGRPYSDPEHPPPPLDVTIGLLTDLKKQISLALSAAGESVLPRVVGRSEFTRSLMPVTPSGEHRPVEKRTIPRPPPLDLPLAGRFLLVAAYCASYNPARSDIRLFGRGAGPDGKKRRGGAMRRAGYGKTRVGKVPQRLLGPRPFPLDRLLALFSSLYAENAPRPPEFEYNPELEAQEDEDDSELDELVPGAMQAVLAQRRREREIEREERWEDEVDHLAFSVQLWALIPELESQGLLSRVSPVDRLDNVMLRCSIDYETAKALAKGLRIPLDEYLYEQIV